MSGQVKQLINDMLNNNAFYIALGFIAVLLIFISVMMILNHRRMKKRK